MQLGWQSAIVNVGFAQTFMEVREEFSVDCAFEVRFSADYDSRRARSRSPDGEGIKDEPAINSES